MIIEARGIVLDDLLKIFIGHFSLWYIIFLFAGAAVENEKKENDEYVGPKRKARWLDTLNIGAEALVMASLTFGIYWGFFT